MSNSKAMHNGCPWRVPLLMSTIDGALLLRPGPSPSKGARLLCEGHVSLHSLHPFRRATELGFALGDVVARGHGSLTKIFPFHP